MAQVDILYPIFALVGLTFAVALRMVQLRFRAVRFGELRVSYFKLHQGGEPPAHLTQVTRNFHNLLEMPPLFYLGCVLIFVLNATDKPFVVMAWAYVITRVLHTLVHTGHNNILHRLIPFLLSAVVLVFIWARLFYVVLTTQ